MLDICKVNRFLCTVFCLLLVFSGGSFAEKLTLGCANFYPLSGQELESQGFYNQIVKKAGTVAGLEVKIKIMPWRRVLTLTKEGKLDGISCPAYRKERELWLAFTKNPFLPVDVGLFARKDSQIQGVDLNSLKDKQIGVLAYSNNLKFLTNYNEGQFTIKEFFYKNNVLKMLHGKRFDALYIPRIAGEKTLADKFPEIADDIEYVGTLSEDSIHPGINLKHPRAKEITKKLDVGYQIIKENGQLAKILEDVL